MEERNKQDVIFFKFRVANLSGVTGGCFISCLASPRSLMSSLFRLSVLGWQLIIMFFFLYSLNVGPSWCNISITACPSVNTKFWIFAFLWTADGTGPFNGYRICLSLCETLEWSLLIVFPHFKDILLVMLDLPIISSICTRFLISSFVSGFLALLAR